MADSPQKHEVLNLFLAQLHCNLQRHTNVAQQQGLKTCMLLQLANVKLSKSFCEGSKQDSEQRSHSVPMQGVNVRQQIPISGCGDDCICEAQHVKLAGSTA